MVLRKESRVVVVGRGGLVMMMMTTTTTAAALNGNSRGKRLKRGRVMWDREICFSL